MLNEIFIIGKPNVGKSSLFNSFVEKKLALVQNIPGVTVDIRKKKINFFENDYVIFDSAGISNNSNWFSKEVRSFTINNITESAIILFVIDGKQGIDNDDLLVCKLVRKLKNQKFLVINKSEGRLDPFIKTDCFKLGLGDPVFVSSAHNIGIHELKLEIDKFIPKKNNKNEVYENKKIEHSIAIVGQTNSGKSTLLNCFGDKKIAITSEKPNLTRDPVESNIQINDLYFRIFDTAGLSTIKNFSEQYIKEQISLLLPQTKEMPTFFISAKKKIGIEKLKNGILDFLNLWVRRINTAKLNKWLGETVNVNPPALKSGKEVKLKYITQISSRPPKFKIFSNFPS